MLQHRSSGPPVGFTIGGLFTLSIQNFLSASIDVEINHSIEHDNIILYNIQKTYLVEY